uniref:methyl-accepting chemotaxis protein n=1 Tax=Agathobacter sp. TaxID=2021311 RepID=UPI0040569848
MREKKKKEFGIEKKISKGVAKLVITFNVILGLLAAVSNYYICSTSVSAVLNEASHIAGNLVNASLEDYVAIAYETGSIARLADPERAVEDKKAIIEQRVEDHGLTDGMLLDASGVDIFTGADYSDNRCYTEAMNGNTYVSTPEYDEKLGHVTFMVSAPLWEGGIPHTTPIGAVVYVPNGEALDEIMRSIEVGDNGSAFMVDSTGVTIADIDSVLVGRENLIEEGKKDSSLKAIGEIVEKMAAGEEGVGVCFYAGQIEMITYSPVPEMEGWSIGICAALADFVGPLIATIIIIVVLVILFTAIGLVLGSRTGKKIVKPIAICVDRLNLLAEGDLTTEIPLLETGDETAVLMKAMGDTTDSLNEIISDISYNLEELSNGNLTVDVSKDYQGDFAQIGKSFRGIVESLNQTMHEINQNADQVSKGSDDVAGASQSLAEGATDQAHSIQDLTLTVEDISEKIQNNAEQAGEVRDIVGEMNHDIQQSNHHMNNMTVAMGRIADSSNEIANIMRTIEEIASQTNLLSLNASIEAARAGESGRGFAIVADEIRALAEQTAVSARDTAELIKNALSAVEEGTSLTKITAASLEQVVDKANDVRVAVDNIAEASEKQAQAVEQISQGVSQIAAVVESNSATAQESAASSEELSALAAQLKGLLEKFTYK